MRITRKFKNLTKYTYTFGEESQLEAHLPKGYTKDQFGNYFIIIGDDPTTMFTCHLDTAAWKKEKVNHVFEGKYIKTDGTTILGADDKAGMVILLYMIENNVPGLYYFFVGEESGCIGSGQVSKVWHELPYSKNINKCISFDRRGTSSIITEQMYGVCCSDEFAISLSRMLNETPFGFKYQPDDTGIFTDSAKFMALVPECTNISVGYYSEHTTSERQDIDFLTKLCKASVMIDWESLPIKRDPDTEDWMDDFDEDDLEEEEWSFSNYSYFMCKDEPKKMYISKTQIQKEILEIESWLKSNDSYAGFTSIDWNGDSLEVEVDDRLEKVGSRIELVDFIPSLKNVPSKELTFSIKKKRVIL